MTLFFASEKFLLLVVGYRPVSRENAACALLSADA